MLKHVCFFLTLSLLISIATLAIAQAENIPWWWQNYESTDETTTELVYGKTGVEEKTSTTSTLTFYPDEPKKLDTLTEEEQKLYTTIDSLHSESATPDTETLLLQMQSEFATLDPDAVQGVLQLYYIETATGSYSYLQAPPSAQHVTLYNDWLAHMTEKHPTPPETVAAMNKIYLDSMQTIADAHNVTLQDVTTAVDQVRAHIQKQGLQKNTPLTL